MKIVFFCLGNTAQLRLVMYQDILNMISGKSMKDCRFVNDALHIGKRREDLFW